MNHAKPSPSEPSAPRPAASRRFPAAARKTAALLLLAVPTALLATSGGREKAPAAAVNAAGAPLAPSPSARALPVRTLRAEPTETLRLRKVFTGVLAPRRSTELSMEREGRVDAVLVDEGRRVEAGELLAQLDTARLQLSRDELLARKQETEARLAELHAGPREEVILAARAQVREAEKNLDLLQIKNKRRIRLLDEGVIAAEENDEISFGMDAAQARLDAARHRLAELEAGTRPEILLAQEAVVDRLAAQVASLDLEIERSGLRAPFGGTVVARLVDEGTVVAAGQPLLRLIESQALEARVGVPADLTGELAPDSSQTLTAGERSFAARVTAVLPELDPATRTRTVILALDGAPPPAVVAGQVVRLELAEEVATRGFWLPTTSLAKGERGLWSCYVVGVGEQVERREVEVLFTETDRVLVRGTLQAGEIVIAGGVDRVVVGQRVQPRED